MANVPVKKVGVGVHPIRGARNGAQVAGPSMSAYAAEINMLANRRLKELFSKYIGPTRAVNAAGDTAIWRWRGHTSPNVKDVWIRGLQIPAEDTGVIDPSWYVRVTPAGGALYDNPALYSPGRVPAATAIVPDHFHAFARRLRRAASTSLLGNTTYEFELHVVDRARVVALTCYEEIRNEFDPTTAGLLGTDPSKFGVGAQILLTPPGELHNDVESIWKYQGTPHFAWCVDDATAATRTSATYVNLLDGSAAGWAATSAGFPAWPYKRGSYNSDDVPVEFCVYAQTAAGTAGKCRVVSNGATVASITNIGTTLGWYTVSANLNAANADDLLVLEFAGDGVNQVSIHAACLYEYLA